MPLQAIIIVTGSVQQVNFRNCTRKAATALGLVGTVENLYDGSVRIVAQGSQEQLQAIVSWCETTGSPRSKVKQVTFETTEVLQLLFKSFKVVRE